MLDKTEGIVLRLIKYSDNSRVLIVFTKQHGKQAYFLNQSKSKKTGRYGMMTQPFSLIEIMVSGKGSGKGMGRIKEMRLTFPTLDIREDMIKTSIILFINEIVNKCIREEEKNEHLFDFLKHAILSLEQMADNVYNFHLHFLVKFANFLGIYPQNNYEEEGSYFDMMEGCFTVERPMHNHVIEPDCARLLFVFMRQNYGEPCNVSRGNRQQLIRDILTYYELHIPNFGTVNSLSILAQVMA